MRRPMVKLALGALALAVVLGGLALWRLFRVEDIPEQLEEVEADPAQIVIEGMGDQAPLRLRELQGRHAFFVLVGPHSAKSREGETINRALNRWTYPETTVGFIIGDAEGFGVFREKITGMMEHFAEELRFPLYADFEGVFMQTFKLPKGHHALVVLGPEGEVLLRRSGGVEGDDDIEQVRTMLGASEPPPGPEAPTFSVGPLDQAHCAERICAIAFLGEAVARTDIPGIDGGFSGDDDEGFAKMRNPSIRIMRTLLPTRLEKAEGVVVGRTSDLELETWSTVDEAADARAAFDLAPDEAALVVIEHGRISFFDRGLIALYRWSTAADLLGIDINDRRPPKGKD
jgi:predicted transcriptional regulator